MKTGRVDNVEYTHDGAGNQWTTIDGARYATFWDIRTRDWRVGDRVTFDTYQASLWNDGQAPIAHAHNIHKEAR